MTRAARPAVRPMLVLLGAAAVLFLALTFKPAVSGDGVGYFSYLHSVIVDHDLDMSNEYAAALNAGVEVWPPLVSTRTPTGLLANWYPVGPALLAAPMYGAAVLIDARGAQFAPPFTTAYTLASLLYGLLALALSYRLARSVVRSSRAALIGAVAVGLASPLLYYLVYQPSYSHAFSAFMVSVFVLLWWRGRGRRTAAGWALLGLVGGLMALVRYQDGPLMLIALLDLPRDRRRVLAMVPGALLGFAPQLVADRIIAGTWLPSRPDTEGFSVVPGHYLQVLFGSWHGLFTWTPILIIAVIGYVFIADPALRAAFAIAFAVELLITGAYPVWWGGLGFGMRYLIDLTPFFVLGLAAVAARWRLIISLPAIALATAWSLLLIDNMTVVIRQDIDPGYAGLLAGQLRAIPYLPHLLQGDVVRGLLLHKPPRVVYAVLLLGVEIAAVAAALWVAARGAPARAPATTPSSRRSLRTIPM